MSIFSKSINRIKNFGKRKSFSLNELDIKLDQYINLSNGFFIEAGANNGIDQSNTLYFEKYRNWRGLLIEPVPELAAKCKANKPRCIIENAVLVPFDYPDSHIEMRYCNLMSQVKGAMKSEDKELQHIEQGCEIQKIKTYDIQVPARTLSSILEEHHIKSIDLLSLDVEGFELSVFKGLDLDKHKPRFILVEARYREEIENHLQQDYYALAELSHHDVLYRCR